MAAIFSPPPFLKSGSVLPAIVTPRGNAAAASITASVGAGSPGRLIIAIRSVFSNGPSGQGTPILNGVPMSVAISQAVTTYSMIIAYALDETSTGASVSFSGGGAPVSQHCAILTIENILNPTPVSSGLGGNGSDGTWSINLNGLAGGAGIYITGSTIAATAGFSGAVTHYNYATGAASHKVASISNSLDGINNVSVGARGVIGAMWR